MPHLRRQLRTAAITTRTGIRCAACTQDNLICSKVTIGSLNTCCHAIFNGNFSYLAIGNQLSTVVSVDFYQSIYYILSLVANGENPIAAFYLGFKTITFQKAHNIIITKQAQCTIQETTVTGNVLNNVLQFACVSNIAATFTGNEHLFTGHTHFFNYSNFCTIGSSRNTCKQACSAATNNDYFTHIRAAFFNSASSCSVSSRYLPLPKPLMDKFAILVRFNSRTGKPMKSHIRRTWRFLPS